MCSPYLREVISTHPGTSKTAHFWHVLRDVAGNMSCNKNVILKTLIPGIWNKTSFNTFFLINFLSSDDTSLPGVLIQNINNI